MLIMSYELKHLYTALTRARIRVIIYDEDEVRALSQASGNSRQSESCLDAEP